LRCLPGLPLCVQLCLQRLTGLPLFVQLLLLLLLLLQLLLQLLLLLLQLLLQLLLCSYQSENKSSKLRVQLRLTWSVQIQTGQDILDRIHLQSCNATRPLKLTADSQPEVDPTPVALSRRSVKCPQHHPSTASSDVMSTRNDSDKLWVSKAVGAAKRRGCGSSNGDAHRGPVLGCLKQPCYMGRYQTGRACLLCLQERVKSDLWRVQK
jgi:hypothetical protein